MSVANPPVDRNAGMVPRSRNFQCSQPYFVRKEPVTVNYHSWHLWSMDGYYGEFANRAEALERAFRVAGEMRNRPATRRIETGCMEYTGPIGSDGAKKAFFLATTGWVVQQEGFDPRKLPRVI